MREYEKIELYKDMLDEIYGEIKVCGMTYAASKVLKDVDPIAFSCGFADWEAEEFQDDEDEDEDEDDNEDN